MAETIYNFSVPTEVLAANINSQSTSIKYLYMGAKNGYNYQQLATKGIFNFTNSLACGYVFIFVLLLINLKKENNKFNLVNIVLLVLSLYMLGSRVSSYFPLILLVATICISLFIS